MITRIIEPSEEPNKGKSGFVRIVAEGLTTGELWLAEPGLKPLPYGIAEPIEDKSSFVKIVAEGLTTGELWVAEPALKPPPYGPEEPEGVVEEQEKGVRATKPVVPLVARVIEAEGVCPMGYKFQIKDVWTLNGEEHGASGLCPVAKKALLEARERLCRDEKSILEKVLCRNGRHMVAFELERQVLGNK